MREGAVTPAAARTACASPPDIDGRSAPMVEISVGAAVIRVSADIGETELRRVIRAVRSA